MLPVPEDRAAPTLEITSRHLVLEGHWGICGLGSVRLHDSAKYALALVELVRIASRASSSEDP
jgi:hypothetical protein